MKNRRKMYQDVWWAYSPQGNLVGILFILILMIFAGLYVAYRHYVMNQQAQEAIKKRIEAERSTGPTTVPKPPPPGESAKGGHWHGDIWHAEPHAHVIDAQVVEQAVKDGEMQVFSGRTPEFYEAWRKWNEWHNKLNELHAKHSQAGKEHIDLSPATDEELKRFETDKEWQRKLNEASTRAAKLSKQVTDHMKEKAPFPYISNSGTSGGSDHAAPGARFSEE